MNGTGSCRNRFTLPMLCLLACIVAHTGTATAADDEPWIGAVRGDHPRLFFNADTWPAVKARATGAEASWFAELKKMADGYPEDPQPGNRREDNADRLRADGTVETVKLPRPTEWGVQAGRAAFVYLVTGDRVYLNKAKKMLKVSVDAYHECIDKGMAVDWYSTSRVHWLIAYDWLYNDLTPAERRELMGSFLRHVDSVRPRPDRKPIHRLNDSGPTTGFYGDRNLSWFTGIAAMGDGIDDALALELAREGYGYNMELFEYRKACAGDDGGLASATTTYAIAHYPWSQFNFLYTVRSATRKDISGDWPYLAWFPVWIMWNWLPGPAPREFGSGDVYHYDNRLWVENLYMHMSQFMDFYGTGEPECAALAAYIRTIVPKEHQKYNWTWFFYPFLLTNIDRAPAPKGPDDTALHARHFENLGQVFMRSGSGERDTYSLFTIGSKVPSHKQFDENNFIIYKRGYLAQDTGTRGASTDFQLRHYYAQTVAHNCVLIHMPDEPFPEYWGLAYDGPEGKINHGGMSKTNGGVCAAFETNEFYSYVAGDATACYLPEKCGLALRQYVFVYPDYFIVCDRVNSPNAAYRKQWLLHTQNEPVVDGRTFRADHEEGRLFVRTLYPRDAVLDKVGGPGREFRAAGKNWELAPETAELARTRYNGALFGNWRMEISPGAARKEDLFIHLLQAADRTTGKMTESKAVTTKTGPGVRFKAGDRTVTVSFGAKGGPTGRIRIESGSKVILDRALTTGVQPQSGLSGDGGKTGKGEK